MSLLNWSHMKMLTLGIAIFIGLGAPLAASHAENARSGTQASGESDLDLATRVKNALHSDPYVYDKHVTVSVENGDVILRGFVFSEWDLRNAIRIATQAAGGRKVVDDISIKEGGPR
jgi:osmotically-inducible protein OsmY